MEKNITDTCKDDLRAVMRNIIGESPDTIELKGDIEIDVHAPDTSHYVVCGFRYDSAKKDYYISAYRGYPYEDDKSVIREISVKDMDVEDAKSLLNSGVITKAQKQVNYARFASSNFIELSSRNKEAIYLGERIFRGCDYSAFYMKYKPGTKILIGDHKYDIGGKSVEDVYQTIVKGYATKELGKGKSPKEGSIFYGMNSDEFSRKGYLPLIGIYAQQNPEELELLKERVSQLGSNGPVTLTDMFWNEKTLACQAVAWSMLVNGEKMDYSYIRSADMGLKPAEQKQEIMPKEAPATVFEEYKGYGYSARTYENARKADLTLALAVDFTTAGEKCTINAAGDRHIPVDLNLPVDDGRKEAVAMTILQKCSKLGLDSEHLRLNIAGNGIYTLARNGWTQERADAAVTDILASLQNHGNIHIDSIRSGGQTGIDEAGIKAGVALGLPTTVLAPKGWAFRTANRQDIFSEAAFKARFSTNPKKELAKETPVKAHSVTADGPTWTPCRRNDGLMNYRDAAGHVLLKNWVDDALPFKDGKAECRIGKTGYIIDTKGIVIDRARWTAQSQSNTNGPKI